MSADNALGVVAKGEANEAEFISDHPEAKRNETLVADLPAAARRYRGKIAAGLQNNAIEAARARV